MLHNNLGYSLWAFEGPHAALDVMRAGIAFAQARGLTEAVDGLACGSLEQLFDVGEFDEALELAARLAERLETGEDAWDLITVRSAQARIFALRGQTAQVASALDWLESSSRGAGSPEYYVVSGLGSSASARAEAGQHEQAAALLAEIEATPDVRENVYYAAYHAAMVRTALAVGERELAARLGGGLRPIWPYAEHALVATRAALAEAGGDPAAAADGYADAASRWEHFGVVPEQAFALLGRGRCLLGLSLPTEAAPVLQHAREIFERLRAAPALAETDRLLQQATALSW